MKTLDSDVIELDRQITAGMDAIKSKQPVVNLDVYVKASTLDNMDFSRNWLVEGLIEDGRLYEIFGCHKSGKTVLTLDMLFHICQGAEWAGKRTIPALVVYVAGEAVRDVEMRLAALRLRHNMQEDIPFYIRTQPVYMSDEVFSHLLATEVNKLKESHPGLPSVVVWDTVNRNLGPGADENAGGLQLFVNHVIDIVLKPTESTGLAIHHSGHGDKDRGRGHSSFPAAVDGILKISKDKGTGPAIVTMEAMEMRSTAGDDQLSFRIETQELPGEDNFGNILEAPILRHLSDYAPLRKPAKAALGRRQKAALSELKRLHKAHRKRLEDEGYPPAQARVKLADWKQACLDNEVITNRQAFHEVKESLKNKGLCHEIGNHYAVPKEETPNDENVTVTS